MLIREAESRIGWVCQPWPTLAWAGLGLRFCIDRPRVGHVRPLSFRFHIQGHLARCPRCCSINTCLLSHTCHIIVIVCLEGESCAHQRPRRHVGLPAWKNAADEIDTLCSGSIRPPSVDISRSWLDNESTAGSHNPKLDSHSA